MLPATTAAAALNRLAALSVPTHLHSVRTRSLPALLARLSGIVRPPVYRCRAHARLVLVRRAVHRCVRPAQPVLSALVVLRLKHVLLVLTVHPAHQCQHNARLVAIQPLAVLALLIHAHHAHKAPSALVALQSPPVPLVPMVLHYRLCHNRNVLSASKVSSVLAALYTLRAQRVPFQQQLVLHRL